MKLKLLQIVTNHSGYQFLKQISIKIRLFHEFRKLEGIFFVISFQLFSFEIEYENNSASSGPAKVLPFEPKLAVCCQ